MNISFTIFLANILPHTAITVSLFQFFSFIGSYGMIWIVIACFLLYEEYIHHKKFIIPLVISLCLSTFSVNVILKQLFAIARPLHTYSVSFFNITHPLLSISYPSDFSFPSGHATVAFAGCYFFIRSDPKRKYLYGITAILIAYSRVFLLQHYAFDIIAGSLLGIAISHIIYTIYFHEYKKQT